MPSDGAAARLLEDWLRRPLPLAPEAPDSLPAVLRRPGQDFLPLAGAPLGEVLTNPATDVGMLEAVKDYFKELSSRSRRGDAHAATVTIYYAAIAAALVFQGRRITAHSPEKLEKSLGMLIAKPWMAPDLARLFERARKSCRNPT
jgi:hypothetical protein